MLNFRHIHPNPRLMLALVSVLFISACGSLIPSVAQNASEAEFCTVKPGSVHDGDTFRLLCSGAEEFKIRLCGVDAPEIGQPLGYESRDYLRSRLPDNKAVLLQPLEEDQYGRLVAQVKLGRRDNSPDLGEELVRQGWAWHYEQYSETCLNRGAIAAAERQAKRDKVGVFSRTDSIPPWEWRRR